MAPARSPTSSRDSIRGASTSCIVMRSTRPGTVLSRRVSHRDRERRRRRVPDGRRPVTRSEVPAVADRGHGGRGSRHRLALHPRRRGRELAIPPRDVERFRQPYIRTVTGLRIHDCTGGFRCWRREALARIPLDRITSDGYSFLVEVAFHAAWPACASPNGRSCSSNAGWARRSCRAAC